MGTHRLLPQLQGRIRAKLVRWRSQLAHDAETHARAGQLFGEGQDSVSATLEASAESAADLEAVELNLALSQAELSAIREIDAALRRLASGEYGQCERCGGAISLARLQAIPWTRVCRTCAAAAARKLPTLVVHDRAA